VKIVGVSGSLREKSSNAAILRAAQRVAPAGVELELLEAIGTLPHFNPELDAEGEVAPQPVADFRARLAAAHAVVFCSPEYAHGVPGALKNALDWLVSTVELIGKPVAVISVSPSGGEYAQTQLMHTLATMSWTVVEPACLRIALGRAQLDEHGELADPAVIDQLRKSIATLAGGMR
jgi:NAD(P)H-dependent FMN reductase